MKVVDSKNLNGKIRESLMKYILEEERRKIRQGKKLQDRE